VGGLRDEIERWLPLDLVSELESDGITTEPKFFYECYIRYYNKPFPHLIACNSRVGVPVLVID
jgi:hypothetical protein